MNVKKKYFIISVLPFLLSINFVFSQGSKNPNSTKSQTANINDLQVSLHEEIINNVFSEIGEITGTNEYKVLLITGKYHWTVSNSKINLRADSSFFTCDSKVEVGPFNYKTPVKGKVKIWFDNPTNKINVKITTAIFELYTNVLGKKIHIKNIELADYFKDPFQFDGPKDMATDFEFWTPDSVKKKIYMKPCNCALEVKNKEIITKCEVTVSNKPIKDKVEKSNLTNNESTEPKKEK